MLGRSYLPQLPQNQLLWQLWHFFHICLKMIDRFFIKVLFSGL